MLRKQFEKRRIEAIGIMSGTSLDGIDLVHVVITPTSDSYEYQQKAFKTYAYSEQTRMAILKESNNQTSTVQGICSLHKQIGLLYVEALEKFIDEFAISIENIAFIASHGQTIWHNPSNLDGFYSSTLQIGDPSVISYRFNKMVIYDFRALDMASGGQGAPLVPMSEYILFKNETTDQILVNIGGISNLTYLKKASKLQDIVAFDTGPGNMLIDMACQKYLDKAYDQDGKYASRGQVNRELLAYLKEDEYLVMAYPKSTGREKYGKNYLAKIEEKFKNIDIYDLICTLTVFTAELIIDQINYFFPTFIKTGKVIISGGGANNPYLISHMKSYYQGTLVTLHEMGYDPDAKEALAFVVLGHLRLLGIPANVPKATSAEKGVCLGSIVLPPGGINEY